MRMKYENPKLKQSQIANQLGYSSSTLQSYRKDINMPSPYIIQSNNTNNRTKKSSNSNSNTNSHPACDVKRPQMTSSEHITNAKSIKKNKNNLEAGSILLNLLLNSYLHLSFA